MNILIPLDYVTVFGRRNKHQFERTQFGTMAEIGTFPRCPGLHSPTVALGSVWVRQVSLPGIGVGRNPQTHRWGHGELDPSHGTSPVMGGPWLRVSFSPAAVLSLGGVCRRRGMCCAAQP